MGKITFEVDKYKIHILRNVNEGTLVSILEFANTEIAKQRVVDDEEGDDEEDSF